ncbi:PepSY-associated TM helix domain-containing protein [Tardiphaga sp. 813_E8_N1_3]|uniref:PepSY-associated TM helix domain-containing protein n=1 Tax=Tardiphaga sp. 813_E8_N1_3 TaxID=3240760 RepID=UPI003F23EB69
MSATADIAKRPAAERGLRPAMAELHTWGGLLFGWLLFAIFATGTVSYFRDEISLWMRPEIGQFTPPRSAVAADVALRQLEGSSLSAKRWMIDLPTDRTPVTSALVLRDPKTGPGATRLTLDPVSGTPIKTRNTAGGDFLYYFHFDLYMPQRFGRYLTCTAAIVMLVAFVSGVITHRRIFKDFFTFRPRKGQRSWLDAHNALGVLALPFHVMITYTGLITLLPLYLPWGIEAMYPDGRQKFVVEMFDDAPPRKPVNIAEALTPIAPLLVLASTEWQGGTTGRIVVDNPGDRAATIRLVRQDSERISHAVQSMLFDGTTGALISKTPATGRAAEARGIFHGLHLARFSDIWLRWMFFVSGIVGCAMIATGLVLWAVKRRRNAASAGHRIVDALNVTAITGLSIAIASYFLCNRLVSATSPGRAVWEVGSFFGVWLIAGLHAAIRTERAAWREQLWVAAATFAAVPMMNAIITGRGLPDSLARGDWVFAGFDLVALATAALFATIAVYYGRRHKEAA